MTEQFTCALSYAISCLQVSEYTWLCDVTKSNKATSVFAWGDSLQCQYILTCLFSKLGLSLWQVKEISVYFLSTIRILSESCFFILKFKRIGTFKRIGADALKASGEIPEVYLTIALKIFKFILKAVCIHHK